MYGVNQLARHDVERLCRLPIVVLTGAGVSAESGIRIFRDAGGLWEGQRVEDVATPEAFQRNPVLVHDFYNLRRRQLVHGGLEPNAAHRALVQLEREWPRDVLVVTQNVDDLHERAGARNLVHMHGELRKVRCERCGKTCAWETDLSVETPCVGCRASGGLRPDVVWFGEIPHAMDRIEAALLECGLFLSVGTSGHVYPAAGFVRVARAGGAVTAEVNLEPSQNAEWFFEGRYGPATRGVPELVEELLALVR